MNILQKLFGGKKAAPQAQPLPFQFVWTGSGFSMIPAATTSYITEGYAGNSAVYTVVNAMMQKFAQVPYYIYKVKSQKHLRSYKAATQQYNERGLLLKAQAMDEVSDNDPIAKLLHKPNDYQTESEFRMMAMCFLKLTGLSPIYANKGLTGTNLQSLHVLPSQWVSLQANKNLTDAEKIWFSPFGAGVNELPREQVYLWKYLNPNYQTDGSHLYGLSPLKAGLMDLKGSNEAAKQMAKMYENGGARGAFAPKNAVLTKEQISAFRQVLEDWITGSDNRGKTGGLSIPVEFHNIGLDAVDMALINGKQISDERIALIFGYPPELLKSDNKYDNAQNALRKLVTNGLYGDLTAYRDIWNNWVLPLAGYNSNEYFVDFDISVLAEMQADMEKVVNQAKEMWWITPNEKRQLSKYDSLPDPAMDTVFIPSGFVPIGETMINDVQITGDYGAA